MSKSNKRITMSELARLADVDVSTVSRALNDSPLVKPDTKEHILKIAADVGYMFNASARNLRRQSSDTLGIVIPIDPASGQTISDPFFLEMVGAVSHAASRRGFDLIISIPQTTNELAERRLLLTGRADGLIVIGEAGRGEKLEALNASKKNIVVWGGRHEQTSYPLVGSDNIKGGYLATRHLLNLGRRSLLFIGDVSLPEVGLRYKGFIKAHEELGFDYDRGKVLILNFGGNAAFNAIKTYPKISEIDGIIAASDVFGIASIQALQALGKRVPDDISVVGYDDVGQAKLSTPALTTINQNIGQAGEMLVDMLLRKIGGEDVENQFTDTELVVRQSCGGVTP